MGVALPFSLASRRRRGQPARTSIAHAAWRALALGWGGRPVTLLLLHPGWVQTDMGGQNANRTVEEGADGVVWAATLPNNGPTGGFFRDRRHVAW